MPVSKCIECGAQLLEFGPARCPLCGAEVKDIVKRRPKADQPKNVDDYQTNVRVLREQLRKLRREDAEAV